jgi:putative methionine-R-sulfoxide reductase with GAF domain
MTAQLDFSTAFGDATHPSGNITNLFLLAGEIGREPNLNGLLLKILERSRPWMQADACSIFLPDPETGELVIHSAHGSSAPQLGQLRIPPGRGIVGSAMLERKVIKVDDVSKDPRFFAFADKETGYRTRAILASPLLDGDDCIGVIEFLNPINREHFNDADVQMVEYFSWLVSASLVRIRSHEAALQHAQVQRDLDLAREMQIGLLPTRFPTVDDYPQIELYASLDPAFEVSGDLYDFFEIEDGKICFLVGDVAGKGVAAGLFMAVTRTLIRAITSQRKLSPTEILEAVNRQLVPENSALLFVTIILGILDPETGDIAYGQGGHNPPLLIRNNGGLSYEPPGGQPLGVFAEAIFGERKIRLEPGDSLLVYTDGVTEAMNSLHQQFGEQRLKEVFESKGNLSACEMTAAVIDSVHEFVGKAEQSDDISLMVIKRRV